MRKWWEAEKKKIAAIEGVGNKAAYIWEYYKLWIIGILAGIFLIVYVIVRVTTALSENWFYIMFTNTFADLGDDCALKQEFVDTYQYDLSQKNVVFNNCAYFDYANGVTGNTYFETFVAYTDAGTLDAVTMEADSLISLGESGRLLDLDSEACASIKEKYGDRFLYCQPYDTEYSTEPVAIGIDISDSRLMTEYNIYPDSCAIGIGAMSQNVDAVENFLDMILDEAE